MSTDPADITLLLRAAALGDAADRERLALAIYDDLKRIAASQLRRERADHSLNPTALVHEAYIRLINQHDPRWTDRLHFFSIAARIIRRILTDHARGRDALKRGGGCAPLRIEQQDPVDRGRDIDLIALDEALAELAQLSERQARIVELRFFGGLTIPEIAEALSMGHRSVDREWQAARAWLSLRLSDSAEEPADAAGT